jgi:hypothetical protein
MASAKGPIQLQVDATDTVHKVFSVIEVIPLHGEDSITLLYPRWEIGSHATCGVSAQEQTLIEQDSSGCGELQCGGLLNLLVIDGDKALAGLLLAEQGKFMFLKADFLLYSRLFQDVIHHLSRSPDLFG